MASRPAATFDLWHTLVYLDPDEEARYLAAQRDAAVAVLESFPRAPGAKRVGRRELRAAFEAELRRAVAASHEGRSVTSEEQIARAARSVGRLPHPGAYDEAVGRIVRSTEFRAAPHALEALTAVRDLGARVGVVSNTVGEPGRFLHEILSRRGFDRAVEVYTFSDEHPWTKPAPEIFRYTLDQLNATPSSTVHVGDGWADLEGARRAGLRAGILYTGLQHYSPEYRALNYAPPIDRSEVDEEVSDLLDVVPLLRSIFDLPRVRRAQA
jgi:FMN phosphatase YigB (HAD superfamily)